MPITAETYIFPPRATECLPRTGTDFLGSMGWIAQYKYNDSRALIKYLPDGTIELWNRHAERFRDYHAPDHLLEQLEEVRAILGLADDTVSILDGGVLDKKHHAIKDTIVIWDILIRDGKHLLGTTYQDRYNSLMVRNNLDFWHYCHGEKEWPIGYKFTDDILMPQCIPAEMWEDAWVIVDGINAPFTIGSPGETNYEIKPLLEGLVFKDPAGILENGYREKNNSSWMVRSRVTTGRHRF
jgi:hypothetical protein